MASDKTIVLITGSNSGIGYTATQLLLSDARYHIIATARSAEKGEAALAEFKSQNPAATLSFAQLDITSESSISAAAEKLQTEFGRVDILVNNAGIVVTDPKSTIDDLRRTFETNAFGPRIVTEIFQPLLEKSTLQDGAKIIYVTSDLGSIGWKVDPNFKHQKLEALSYRMSKAALTMMAAAQNVDFGVQGKKIRVWAYNPGFTVTNLTGSEGRKIRVEAGAHTVEEGTKALVELVKGENGADQKVGRAVHYDGSVMPW